MIGKIVESSEWSEKKIVVKSKKNSWSTFSELIKELKIQHGKSVAFQYKEKNEVKEKTFLEFYQDIQKVSANIELIYGQKKELPLLEKLLISG